MGNGEWGVFLYHTVTTKDGKTLPATGLYAVPILRPRSIRVEFDEQMSPRAARPTSRITVTVVEHEGQRIAGAQHVKTSDSRRIELDTERGQIGTSRDNVGDGGPGRAADGEVIYRGGRGQTRRRQGTRSVGRSGSASVNSNEVIWGGKGATLRV